MSKPKPFRIGAIDTSFTSPGYSVIEVLKRQPKLIEMTSFKTDTSESYVTRGRHIEAFTHLFIRKHRPLDIIVRESFSGKYQRTNYAIFSAWHCVDRAAAELGYSVSDDTLTPTKVKEIIGGSGKADKKEVAEGVRKLLGADLEFKAGYDDSDACAIGLTWLILNGMIDPLYEPKEPKRGRKK
jgi:crossover junction endodeoxyribonuclease RuvC